MYSMKDFCKKVGLHRTTVLKLEERGIITPLRTPGGQRRYTDEHVRKVYEYYHNKGRVISDDAKLNIIYCRISTRNQRDFLDNQIQACKNFAISKGLTISDVIVDVASSFNFKRPGLKKLLDLICDYKVANVIIYDEDRLSRIAFDLFKTLFERFNTQIIVVDKSISSEKIDNITNELISFIHYITSKIYGKRSYRKFIDKICKRNNKNES